MDIKLYIEMKKEINEVLDKVYKNTKSKAVFLLQKPYSITSFNVGISQDEEMKYECWINENPNIQSFMDNIGSQESKTIFIEDENLGHFYFAVIDDYTFLVVMLGNDSRLISSSSTKACKKIKSIFTDYSYKAAIDFSDDCSSDSSSSNDSSPSSVSIGFWQRKKS